MTRRAAFAIVWPALADKGSAPDTPRNRVAWAANEDTEKKQKWAEIFNGMRPGTLSIFEADAFRDWLTAVEKTRKAHHAWLHPPSPRT